MQTLLLAVLLLLSPQKLESAYHRHATNVYNAIEQGDYNGARLEMKKMALTAEGQPVVNYPPVCTMPPPPQ